MQLPVRRLLKNAKHGSATSPQAVFGDNQKRVIAASKDAGSPVVIKGKSVDVEKLGKQVMKDNEASTDDMLVEVAESGGGGPGDGLGSAMIRGRNVYGSILDEFVYTDIETTDSKQMGRSKDTSINRIYRDIYYHDPICGGGVDMLSALPFSEFSLAGAKQAKYYEKFYNSAENINYRALMPTLSVEYFVQGLFVSTTAFNEEEGEFIGLIPQLSDYVDVQPVPLFGRDPLVTLQIGEAAKYLLETDDPRMAQYAKLIPKDKQTLNPNPEDIVYIPRRAMLRDYRGVSLFRRLLSTWLLERALYRGTLDQAMKRQRSVTHLMLGDTDWTPTQDEMNAIASSLAGADLDPVGALFVTRTGVQVNDIRSANDLWKVTDVTDFFQTNKLRTLGISESFLNGEYSVNALDQAMSVFVEQMRTFRDMLTYEVFYDKTFPRIAKANGFQRRRIGLETASDEASYLFNTRRHYYTSYNSYSQLDLFGNMGFRETAEMSREERNDLFIPEVHWHKRLRPEADDQYLGMLNTISEAGLPVPLRLFAAAAGLDIDAIMAQKNEDMELRDKVKDWIKKIKPAEEGEAGPPGGDQGLGDLSSYLATAAVTKRVGAFNREYDAEATGMKNMAGGKRHIVTAKGLKILEEKFNKTLAESAAKLAQRQNAFEADMEERFREKTVTSKIYT